jgi:prevent-host-death family protein
MEPETVGIRQLKTHLSEYLRRVSEGQTLVVTDRGKPVCRLIPERRDAEARIRELVEAGVLEWSGKKPGAVHGRPRVRRPRTVADLVLEDRD